MSKKIYNISSLVNKLLKEYIKKGNKILEPLNENKE
jgi:hypothetical protein